MGENRRFFQKNEKTQIKQTTRKQLKIWAPNLGAEIGRKSPSALIRGAPLDRASGKRERRAAAYKKLNDGTRTLYYVVIAQRQENSFFFSALRS
jgi:hypothetical protein